MKIPKKEVDPVKWDEAVKALTSGTFSRQQAADHVGLAYSTFCQRLKREVPDNVLADNPVDGRAGLQSWRAKEDPERHDRYRMATALALKTGAVAAAATKYDVNYQVLARKVRAAKGATAT